MAKKDIALSISNPRLIAAIYFGLLSVVGTILINAFLTLIGIQELIPVFESILIGVLVAGCTGAIFGEQIVHCKKPYKQRVFWLGFIMVLASLPVFDLGLVFCMLAEHTTPSSLLGIKSMVYLYLVVLAYSYVLFGIWLAIASGLAAMYLRGQLVYDILHSYKESSIETQVLPVKITKRPYHEDRPGRKTV
ncbi:hypothetical protein [Legionella sp. km772]|uniref:hypothetical protein n=1 Tax=Legionella sp. km772 TaxID=2498111 RepID=UPI001F4520E5|nr:hypothetical protein [Legionella sp. km772]